MIPSSSRIAAACRIVSQSDRLPMMIPTSICPSSDPLRGPYLEATVDRVTRSPIGVIWAIDAIAAKGMVCSA
jgi:hypothetical protein